MSYLRTIEWSAVMGGLTWLLVHLWTDAPPYGRRRDLARARSDENHRASNAVNNPANSTSPRATSDAGTRR